MSIVILSTYDSDGSGVFATQLLHTLQGIGYEAKIICVKSTSEDDHIMGIFDRKPIQHFLYRVKAKFGRFFYQAKSEYAFVDTCSINTKTVLSSDVWPSTCEMIICTFLSGMLRTSCLFQLSSKYGDPPVMFYGVDMNFLTGGCHYARNCQKYLADCSDCPAIAPPAKPFIRKRFSQKYNFVRSIGKHVVIASSDEYYRQLVGSKIFAESDVRKVLMLVDDVMYGSNENNRLELKLEYGFGERTLLLRSSAETRKGCKIFTDCIRHLLLSKPEFIHSIDIVAIGDDFIGNQLGSLGLRFFSLGYISEEEELARLYSVSDVFINTSLADGGPMMLAQSLMSFTPVITTDVGLARDLVITGSNGTILQDPISNNFAEAIHEYFILTDEERRKMRLSARGTALTLLSKSVYIKEMSAIIETTISGDSSSL